MKRKVIVRLAVSGMLLLSVLATGAVKTLVMDSRTVASADDILEIFYAARTGLPPVPSPLNYRTVAAELSEDRFDFLSNPYWGFIHSGGTLYWSEKSKLKLDLPMQLVAYEDLMSGKVVLSGTTMGSKEVQTLAIVDAPVFAEPDGKKSLDQYLMDELWPRRIIWTVELRSEKDATLLSVVEQTLLSAQDAQTGMSAPRAMTTMSAPEPITDFRMIRDSTNLSVNLPAEFAGATITLLSRTNLLEGSWTNVLQTNALSSGVMRLGSFIPESSVSGGSSTNSGGGGTPLPPGGTNTNTGVSDSNTAVTAYFKATAGSTVDSDADGLGNLAEYELGTGYLDVDSDDDGLLDGEEVDAGQDPLTANGIPNEFDSPMQSATNGVFVVLPERCWHAQEPSLNLETYGAYGN